MTTFFLRFPDESAAQSCLKAAGIYVTPEDQNSGYYKQADIGWAFDPIGTITREATFDPETGEELTPAMALDGWHANYAAAALPPELEPYSLDPPPKRPCRVFADYQPVHEETVAAPPWLAPDAS